MGHDVFSGDWKWLVVWKAYLSTFHRTETLYNVKKYSLQNPVILWAIGSYHNPEAAKCQNKNMTKTPFITARFTNDSSTSLVWALRLWNSLARGSSTSLISSCLREWVWFAVNMTNKVDLWTDKLLYYNTLFRSLLSSIPFRRESHNSSDLQLIQKYLLKTKWPRGFG